MASRNFNDYHETREEEHASRSVVRVGRVDVRVRWCNEGQRSLPKFQRSNSRDTRANVSKNLTSSPNLGFSLVNDAIVDIATDFIASIVAYYDKWKTSSTSSSGQSTESEMTIDFARCANSAQKRIGKTKTVHRSRARRAARSDHS